MECQHNFIPDTDGEICDNCGLFHEFYDVPKVTIFPCLIDLNDYLYNPITGDKLNQEIASQIKHLFFASLANLGLKTLRQKKALLAMCHFYICNMNKLCFPFKDLERMFGLQRQHCNRMHCKFLENNRQFCRMEVNISDFVPLIFHEYNFPMNRLQETQTLCQSLDAMNDFVNSNPFVVCLCFVFLMFEQKLTRQILKKRCLNYNVVKDILEKLRWYL